MTSQHVIRSYLAIAGLFTLSASLIWGVNTLFLLDSGLDIAEVFLANAAFTAGMVIFEIPTGVLADTTGRRVSFLMSLITLLIGTLGYVAVGELGWGLPAFVVVSIFLGLGFTFYSGAVEAWLVDALKETGYKEELDHVFARGSMVTGAAMLIGSVSGGIIGTVDLALPFIGRAVLLGIVFVIAFRFMHDLGYQPRALELTRIPAEMKQLARISVQFGWREPHMRLLMLITLIQFGFLSWAFYASQPHFLDLIKKPDAIWIAGVISALMSVSTILGNTLVEWLLRYCGKRTTLMIASTGIFTAAFIGIGLTTSFWVAVPLFLIGMGATGVSGPVRQAYIHHIIPSEQRAAVLSVDAMFGSAGGIVGQTGLGQISLRSGIAQGYLLGGMATILTLPLLLLLRRLGGDADVIVGSASHPGRRVTQSMAQVVAVDSKPHHVMAAQEGD